MPAGAGERRPRLGGVGRAGLAVCVCLTRGALAVQFLRAHHHPLRRRDASAVSCVQITIPFELRGNVSLTDHLNISLKGLGSRRDKCRGRENLLQNA